MTRFRISLAILLVLLGISMGSMAAVRHSGNAVLEAVQQVSETASPTAAQCEAVETAWEKAEPWLLLSVRRDKLMDTDSDAEQDSSSDADSSGSSASSAADSGFVNIT